jgi:hypothetical protein
MREIYKTYSQKGKKQLNTTTISVALLVAATLIFSTAIPVIANQNLTPKLNENAPEEIISDGLAPRSEVPLEATDAKNAVKMGGSPIGPLGEIMYGYNAYPGPEGTIWFDVDDPGTIEECGDTISGDFLAGGTFGCDDIWYGVQYGSGLLYGIDPYNDCEMWVIGGGGTGMNGLAYNPTDNRMYGSSSDNQLYEIDPDSGEQEQIGPFGGGVMYMIGMAFDADGTLFGWDLSDRFWSINTETGEATEIGPLGVNINYAQDGDFHRESDTLYLTAYTSTGILGTVDKETGTFTQIGPFEGGMEVTASIFLNTCIPPEHDIRLVSIDSPQTGRAEPDMDMTITVKNVGNNTETFNAQMEIIKCEAGELIAEHYFDAGIPEDWETDYWDTSYTANAGGQSPEAHVNRYTQYYQGDYYDNYIQSCQTDCTGAEKVNLRFRWAGNYYYPQYANVYVKMRRNSTSPWKDVTPWENPVGENQDGELYEIGCYGFGEPIGEEFQMRWDYIGYWSYFYDLYLDDVTLELCGGCAEYAELEEDITLEKEEEIQIQFPKWTPSEWQNESSENTWEEYPIHAFVMCEGDENPRNDEKWILIDLWYPWMHDIEVMKIDSPQGAGEPLPGQTFPVQATMRNVGQYPECCIPIDMNIGNPVLLGTLMTETDWPGTTNPYGYYYQTYFPGYDNGWRDEHKYISYYYGWRRYYGSYSGGSPYEAYIPYYYARQDYVFHTGVIDASEYQILRLKFLTYVNHYYGQGLYSLEAGYSTDGGDTWFASWHEEPSSSGGYEVDVPIEGGSDNLMIGFWVKGNPYYFNYWYLDNVELVAMGFTEEYYDFACQGPDIEPGEEVTFTFEDWTPARLGEMTSGSEDYIVESSIEMANDKNPANDILTEELTLEFWWDAGIDEVTSPVGEGDPRDGDEELWDNGDPDGRNGLAGSMYSGYSNILIDDFQNGEDWNVQGGDVHFLWNSGYTSNTKTIRVYFFEDEGECDPSLDEYPEPDYVFEASEFTEYTTGQYYFSRPEVVVDFLLGEEAQIPPGRWYVGIQPEGNANDIAYILTAEDKGCMAMADLPYWGYPRWSSSQYLWGQAYDLCYALHGNTGGPPSPKAWIQPGTEDIDAIVKNYGTFPYEDLTCYAEIWEYITDPENGTQVYTDEIGNIDLTTPLGGSRELNFADFTFADEGRYGLFLNLPASPDDVEKNNAVRYGVAVDDTNPDCDYPPILDPPLPDGENGWYVNDVTVTLNATDPWSNGVSSGVREIRYTINGGAEQVIPDKTGSFVLTEDGDDITVEYWAVDYVGNEESSKNTFSVDIDQTVPEVSLSYEVSSGNPIQGWEFTFTALATDVMSDMNRVEFYLNDVLQENVTGTGPDYSWSLMYWPLPQAIFRATAFDNAGLFFSDEIENPKTSSHSTPSVPQSQQTQEIPREQPLPR